MILSTARFAIRRQCQRNLARNAPAVSAVAANNSNNTSSTSCTTTFIATRFYRGESGEEVAKLSKEEEALLKIAKPKAEEIFKEHTKATPDLESRKKRLIYRSKQRGWLEVDLLLGTWANDYVPTLNEDELDQFEDFVNMETIDIYNVITLRLDVPEHMKREGGKGVVERIAEWSRSSPLGKADPETYKKVKTEAKLT